MTPNGSPGSQLRNWRPGDDDAEELLHQKIADALRDGKSERQIAKLLGLPRALIWRGKKLAAIPAGLLERLFQARVGARAMLYIGRCYESGEAAPIETERCPNCGHVLRVRAKAIRKAVDIMTQWVEDGRPSPNDEAAREEAAE